MAKVNGTRWRLYRNALKLTSVEAADLLEISGGHLRQIEEDRKPASDDLVLRAAKLYGCELVNLLATEDPATEPPSKKGEKETNTSPGKAGGGGTGTGKGGKSGPKRVKDTADRAVA